MPTRKTELFMAELLRLKFSLQNPKLKPSLCAHIKGNSNNRIKQIMLHSKAKEIGVSMSNKQAFLHNEIWKSPALHFIHFKVTKYVNELY